MAYLNRWRSLSTASLLFAAVAFAPNSAAASSISFTLAEIATFFQITSSDAATTTINNGIIPAGTEVALTTNFAPPNAGLESANVGLTGLSIAFAAGDTFDLGIKNTNENSWTYELVVAADTGTFFSGSLSLIPGASSAFSTALGAVAGTIASVYIVISAVVPIGPEGDRTAEYHVGVPGPIVGAGLPGLLVACGALALLARRRRQGVIRA